MSKGCGLRAISCAQAAVTAGLALTATAGASGGGRAITAQNACDPATFPAGLCPRPDDSGPRVTFDQVFADLADKGLSGQWRFTRDTLKVHRGEAVTVSMGRGGELHTFTDVTDTAFAPGCVPEANQVLFGRPGPEREVRRGRPCLRPACRVPADRPLPGPHDRRRRAPAGRASTSA